MNINATLFGQSIAFFLFAWFTMKFVWPPIMGALEQRKKTIADGLAAAEKGQHEKVLADKRATEVLKDAKQQAAEILGAAHKRAAEISDEGKESGHAEGERMKAAALAEIEQESNRAREALRAQVVSLALEGAEKVLQREVNADEHNAFLDKLATQL